MSGPDRVPVAWRGPVLAWAALLALLGGTVVAGLLPLGTWQLPVTLGVAGLMVLVLAGGLVGLHRASTVSRLAAAAGLCFVLFLFTMSFADLLTRVQ